MKKNSGSTLLAVLALLVVLSAFIYGAMNYTMNVSRNIERTNALRTATEVGDGALEYAYANWRSICRVNCTSTIYPTATQNLLSGGPSTAIPLPTAAMFPGISNFTASTGANPATGTPYTIANYGVQAMTPEMVAMTTTTTPPTKGNGTNVNSYAYSYLASADVSIPTATGSYVTAKVRRVFQEQTQSPWSFAIFFNDLLEVNPGATMTINGWVHTNSYLYTDYSDLTFGGKVDYNVDWIDGTAWAPGDTDHAAGSEAAPSYQANEPPIQGPVQQPFGIDTASINSTNGTSQTQSQVYSQLIAPGTSNADFGNNSYYNQSGVRIVVTATKGGTPVVTLHSTTGVLTPTTGIYNDHVVTASSTGSDLDIYKVFTAALTTTGTLQDAREGATVNLVQLNMSVIDSAMTAKSTSNNGTYAGLLYGTSAFNPNQIYSTASGTTSSGAAQLWALQLINGATLPAGGLAISSNNGVYILGDYNTGQTSSSKTPANTDNNGSGNNYVSGYTESSSPSSVVGDAIMILSNAWTNAESTSSLTSRVATPTTVNAAIVSGNVPTSSAYSGANSYSGGAENFPRFLENWTGQEFTYYGSMVELFQSQQFTGRWGSANVYDAPNRNWNFDTTFYTNPPPGTFAVFSFARYRWYVQ